MLKAIVDKIVAGADSNFVPNMAIIDVIAFVSQLFTGVVW